MLCKLIKAKFSCTFSRFSETAGGVNKRKGLIYLFIGLMLYAVVAVCAMFSVVFSVICGPLHDKGLSEIYFASAGVISSVLTFVIIIFMARSQIYESSDNDMLLSMPISPWKILFSRVFVIAVLDYFMTFIVAVPAVVIYNINYPMRAVQIILCILSLLIIPAVSLTMTLLIAWIFAALGTHIKHKTIIVLVLTMGFLCVYIFLYSRINSIISYLLTYTEQAAVYVRRFAYPFFLMGKAIVHGDIPSFLLFLVICVIPLVLVYFIVSLYFIKTVTTKKGVTKAVYKEKAMKNNSALVAFIKKELTHFGANPMYIMNASIANFLTVIVAVLLIIKRNTVYEYFAALEGWYEMLPILLILLGCILQAMNFVSAPSISLEGKNLWITLSMPVDASVALYGKVCAHIIVCLPFSVIYSAVVIAITRMDFITAVLSVITPVSVIIFQGFWGVFLNLQFPQLQWQSETAAIKQGIAGMFTMFSTLLILSLLTALYIYALKSVIPVILFLLIICVCFTLFAYLLYRYMQKKGSAKFNALGGRHS